MNLKQLGTGWRMAIGNGGETPWPTIRSTNNASTYIDAIKDELASPKVLVCPADDRTAALTLSNIHIENISYFITPDADETIPSRLLFGDRNITLSPTPNTNVWELGTNKDVGWSKLQHNGQGNLGFSDGSVKGHNETSALRIALTETEDTTNRIVLPISAGR